MHAYTRKRIILLSLFLIVFAILVYGCVGRNSNINTNNMTTSKYVVIEEVKHDEPKVIEGQLDNFPRPFMNDATLDPVYPDQPGKYNVKVNSSLSILYFGYYTMYGPYRNITFVRGIYGFPYQLESGAIILGIDQNSTIHMRYNNESISLDKGKVWTSPITSSWIETRTGYDGNPVKIEHDIYWWIDYHPDSYST